jgi:hypothetical protein
MRKYFEPIIWTLALVVLFFLDPSGTSNSFCLFKLAGFASCWGCGIGHAIHYALHLDLQNSLDAHILGIPASLGLLYNITKSFFKNQYKLTWTHNKCL